MAHERTTTDVWTYGDRSALGTDMVGDVDLTGFSAVSYTHLTLPTTPYV